MRPVPVPAGIARKDGNAPQNEKEISFINISELQKASGRIIPRDSFDYIRSGAGDEITMQRNTTSFNTKEIYPRTFAGIKTPDLHTSVLGIPINLPIITAPMAAHGLAHISAESGTAKGTAAAGSIMSISTYSNQTLEKIAAVLGAEFVSHFRFPDGTEI